MSKVVIAAVALICGAALAAQVGFNNGLRTRIGHPIPAAFLSFSTGTLAIGLYMLATRPGITLQAATRGPWWIWMGGLAGALYVTSAAALGARLGAVAWLGLVITGQVVASVILDHFGLIGFAVHPLNPGRLIGVALLLIGVSLVLFF